MDLDQSILAQEPLDMDSVATLPSTIKRVPTPWTLEEITRQATKLSRSLQNQRLRMYPPKAQRVFRKLSSGEAAKLIGVNDAYLRQLSLDGKGPDPEIQPNGRRLYTLDQVNELRSLLQMNAKSGRRYVKHRTGAEHLQILTCVNFKGGSAKTTTSAHLAQYLALSGYRVLAVDMDPQASLSALHGFQPEYDVAENESLYAAIRYDEHRRNLSEVIRPTHIPGLDIVPANLELMEFEHTTPAALNQRDPEQPMFFRRVSLALSTVADAYDVVVIDCPPQLGFLAIAALSAATASIITVHPQMLDIMSMSQFLTMVSDVMAVVENSGAAVNIEWVKYLITRFEPTDVPQAGVVQFLRNEFGDYVCQNAMVKSTAIADAGVHKQTIYEANRDAFSRGTYDRAIEAMNLVNGEIEELINAAWGRDL